MSIEPPIRPNVSSVTIKLNPSAEAQEADIIFNASGIDFITQQNSKNQSNIDFMPLLSVDLDEICFSSGNPLGPVISWVLYREPLSTEAPKKRKKYKKYGGLKSPSVGTAKEPIYSEDLREKGLTLEQDELLRVRIRINIRSVYDIIATLPHDENGAVDRLDTNLRLRIKGWTADPTTTIKLIVPKVKVQEDVGLHGLALDYGNQDFTFACFLFRQTDVGVVPKLSIRTPSMKMDKYREQSGEKSTFVSALIPEPSRLALHDLYDPEHVIFSSGHEVNPQTGKHLKECIWNDPRFNGARIESLKPYLTNDTASNIEALELYGNDPDISTQLTPTAEEKEASIENLFRSYFQRMVSAVEWGICQEEGIPFSVANNIIITHPVGINREFERNMRSALATETPAFPCKRSVEFINEPMAAIGSIWYNDIKNSDENATIDTDPELDFRNRIRALNNLTPAINAIDLEYDDTSVYIMLVDIGHGTTDLSLCEVYETDDRSGKVITEIKQEFSYSLTLGGRDLTKVIFQNLVVYLKKSKLPQTIIDVLANKDPGLLNETRRFFWRFLDDIEEMKKGFSKTPDMNNQPTEWPLPDTMIELFSEIAEALNLSNYDKSIFDGKYISREQIQGWLKPVVNEIAATIESVSNSFQKTNDDGETTEIDFYSFVGQSMMMSYLKDSIYQKLNKENDSVLVGLEKDSHPQTNKFIEINNPSELKGKVAEGAVILKGGMVANIRAINYNAVERLPYSIYLGSQSASNSVEVIAEGTEIKFTYSDDGYIKASRASSPMKLDAVIAANIVPSNIVVVLRYNDIYVTTETENYTLGKVLGFLYFDESIKGKSVSELKHYMLSFRFTSDEYLVADLIDREKDVLTPLRFRKSDLIFQDSINYYCEQTKYVKED